MPLQTVPMPRPPGIHPVHQRYTRREWHTPLPHFPFLGLAALASPWPLLLLLLMPVVALEDYHGQELKGLVLREAGPGHTSSKGQQQQPGLHQGPAPRCCECLGPAVHRPCRGRTTVRGREAQQPNSWRHLEA